MAKIRLASLGPPHTHVMLMRVFAWDRNRTAAKHQFEECWRLLEKELHNPLRGATVRLAESIAQGDEFAADGQTEELVSAVSKI